MKDARGSLKKEVFGTLPHGEEVLALTLSYGAGLSVRLLTYGASIQSMHAPDRAGQRDDIVLGHASLEEYLSAPQYFGATVGRVANRIANGRFVLDGTTYQVGTNHGPNALHGGFEGFDKRNWTVISERAGPKPGVTLRLVSPAGDQGFPGTLTVTADFELCETGALRIDYQATTDRPTIVNVTNHTYWNLSGEGSCEGALEHELMIPADHYLPVDPGLVPTGEMAPVAGTPFDFRRPHKISARVRDAGSAQIRAGRGYDHNWVVAQTVSEQPRLLARARHLGSGRVLSVHSTQPGLQFYSGNFLDASTAGKSGRLYRMGDAFALEPQMFPDTCNRPKFGTLRLDPGQTYHNTIVFEVTVDANEGEGR